MKFSELFALAANRTEVVCTFLALLELVRLKQLACLQPEPFAEIEITLAEQPPAVGNVPAETAATADQPAPSAPGTENSETPGS